MIPNKWISGLIALILANILAFGVWAGTSIFSIKEQQAVQKTINEQVDSRLQIQGSTIHTFQNILGDIKQQLGEIKASVEVTKTIVEERTRPR